MGEIRQRLEAARTIFRRGQGEAERPEVGKRSGRIDRLEADVVNGLTKEDDCAERNERAVAAGTLQPDVDPLVPAVQARSSAKVEPLGDVTAHPQQRRPWEDHRLVVHAYTGDVLAEDAVAGLQEAGCQSRLAERSRRGEEYRAVVGLDRGRVKRDIAAREKAENGRDRPEARLRPPTARSG